jgi:hypothetical protein
MRQRGRWGSEDRRRSDTWRHVRGHPTDDPFFREVLFSLFVPFVFPFLYVFLLVDGDALHHEFTCQYVQELAHYMLEKDLKESEDIIEHPIHVLKSPPHCTSSICDRCNERNLQKES